MDLKEQSLLDNQQKLIAEIEKKRPITYDKLRLALSNVARQDFFPQGPWWEFAFLHQPPYFQYIKTRDDKVEHLYKDASFALSADDSINNGLPSVVVGWIDDLRPSVGEHVVQIGTGMGFYSAILSHLVGSEGKVTSFETDGKLARMARRHLSNYRNVEVREEDGIAAVQKADVILSHVGTSTLPVNLINNLKVGGRAILTLSSTSNSISEVGIGAAFLFKKVTKDNVKATFSGFPFITTASCERSAQDELVIDTGFEQGGWEDVKSLKLGGTESAPEDCWIQGQGWCLSKCEVQA